MEIKWPNVVAFGLLIVGAVLAIANRRELEIAIAGLGHIGPGSTPEQRFHGFMVLGILSVAFVAIVRLVVNSKERDKDR